MKLIGEATGWYLLQCKHHQDARAEENLVRQGFLCYRPVSTRHCLQARDPKKSGASLFPGYIFVQLSTATDWGVVRSTRGVLRIVAFGNVPAVVPDYLIAQLRAGEQHVEKFEAGDSVQITQGIYQGLRAIFNHKVGTDRVSLLLNVLNEMYSIELPLNAVDS